VSAGAAGRAVPDRIVVPARRAALGERATREPAPVATLEDERAWREHLRGLADDPDGLAVVGAGSVRE
jgi:hypothetical protein